jgi:hypothetical protein
VDAGQQEAFGMSGVQGGHEMTNDEINRKVASIMEPMPSEPPEEFDSFCSSPDGDWWYDVMDKTGWYPLDFCGYIAAAWRCVEWATYQQGAHFEMAYPEQEGHTHKWRAMFDDRASPLTYAAPMAIALAFLAAFGPPNPD